MPSSSIIKQAAPFLLTIIVTSAVILWWLRPTKSSQTNPEKDKAKQKAKRKKMMELLQIKPQIKNKTETIKAPQSPILLQNEIWQDLVDWIPSVQLASGLSLVNNQMHEICAKKMYEDGEHVVNEMSIDIDPYQNEQALNRMGRLRSLIALDIPADPDAEDDAEDGTRKDEDNSNEDQAKEEEEKLLVQRCLRNTRSFGLVQVPLPTTPPPKNILGFRKITIRHLNEQVMTFLRVIIPLFARGGGIPFQFEMNQYPRVISRAMGPGQAKAKCNYQLFLDVHRLLQGNIASLSIDDQSFCDPYWKFIRTFLLDVQFLILDRDRYSFHSHSIHFLPILTRWLQTNRTDGTPRYFYLQYFGRIQGRQLIEILRESFTNATTPSTYILEIGMANVIIFDDAPLPEPFSLRNDQTNERLVLARYQRNPTEENNLILRRFPAIATAIGDDWMIPILDRARQLFTTRISKFQPIDDNGNVQEGPLNQLKLSFDCSANMDYPFYDF